MGNPMGEGSCCPRCAGLIASARQDLLDALHVVLRVARRNLEQDRDLDQLQRDLRELIATQALQVEMVSPAPHPSWNPSMPDRRAANGAKRDTGEMAVVG